MAAAAAAATFTRRASSSIFRIHFRPIISPLPSSIPRLQRQIWRAPVALSSMLPIHSAIASARLVSKLPSEVNACVQGRFANYVSPI